MINCYKKLWIAPYNLFGVIQRCAIKFNVFRFLRSAYASCRVKPVVLLLFFSFLYVDAFAQNLVDNTTGAVKSFVVPAGVTKIIVQTWGGGGSGGSPSSVSANFGGGGGGGGGYSAKIVTVSPGTTYYYNVGAGAAGGSAASGEVSWFGPNNGGTLLIASANGGNSAGNSTNGGVGALPGTTATGGIAGTVYSGGNGGNSSSTMTGHGGSSGGGTADGVAGGNGTSAALAGSGSGQGANGHGLLNTKGLNGASPGAGGSGGTQGFIGGAGGNGQVSISWGSHGSGSRDLFPAGQLPTATSTRAALMSAKKGFYPSAYQFINRGIQKVYAIKGEKLYLGSSAQGYLAGQIKVYKPSNTLRDSDDGTVVVNNGASTQNESTIGRISSRTQELLGPNINGTVPGGYTPFEIDVDETGVWEVHFIAPAGANYAGTGVPAGGNQVLVSANWTQSSASDVAAIVAWDVTVAAKNIPMPGRVYQNVFNTYSTTAVTNGFYGKFYILTEDGYPYLVDNNGMQGVAFTFFVNNRGFTTGANGTGVRTYKSLNSSTNPNVKDPNEPDDVAGANQNITHKIFYGKPGTDLPVSAKYKGGDTWLKIQPPSTPQAVNVTFEGVEGNAGYASSKGGYIKFESNIGGTYRITVPGNPPLYYPRVLVGPMVAGANAVYWDGKSGKQADPLSADLPMPPGSTISNLKVQVFGAEVHFPFLDVEVNPNGIRIQQLDKDSYNLLLGLDKDVVYWNDKDITRTSDNNGGDGVSPDGYNAAIGVGLGTSGVSSMTNGHKWGMTGGSATNAYGNNRALDTYSFVAGPETNEGINVTILEANLEVTNIKSDHLVSTAINVGDQWDYTVDVKNGGPIAILSNSDPANGPIKMPAKFRLYVPAGITIDPTINPLKPSFVSPNQVTIVGTPTFTPSAGNSTGGIYEAQLNMPVGGTATFILPVTVTGVITQTGNGDVNAYATMLRPADFSDPDATNGTILQPGDPFYNESLSPIDPFYEAKGIEKPFSTAIYTNPASIVLTGTNNIKRHSLPSMKADLKIVKTAKQSATGNGVGAFTIEVTNLGTSDASGIVVSDVLSSRYTFTGSTASAGTVSYSTPGAAAGTLTWTIDALAVNESATLTFNTANQGTANRPNTATVRADHFDPILANNTSTVDPGSTTSQTTDLEIVKMVNGAATAAAGVGSTVTFTITVRKKSGNNVNNVLVRDILPSGFTFTSATPSQGSYNAGTGVWNIGSINDTGNRTLEINAIVKASTGTPGEYTNVSMITSTANLDDDPTNNTSSASITIGSLFITNPMIYQRIIK